jgi:hypothetical protein
MAVPPSWKGEIEKAVEEQTDAHSERQETQAAQSAARISEQIKAFVDAYNTQNNKPERKDRLKCFLDIATVVLLFATALFTALAWCVFKGQLTEMRDEQRPWITSPEIKADASKTGFVTFSLIFKNVGHTPPKGLVIDAKFVSWGDAEKTATEICEISTGRKDFFTRTIVPGSDLLIRATESTKPYTFVDVPVANLERPENQAIAGCSIYDSPFDQILHQTAFVALIRAETKGFSVDHVFTTKAN